MAPLVKIFTHRGVLVEDMDQPYLAEKAWPLSCSVTALTLRVKTPWTQNRVTADGNAAGGRLHDR